jgi:Fe-S cluster assembly protein SufB
MTNKKKDENLELNKVISEPYKYGFITEVENESFPYGINEEIVKLISTKKNEPEFLLDFRLKSYKKCLN